MATVNGIASTTGLRAQAVAGWADENGVNLSKVADDLKSKKLKPMDFMTAVVGNPGNKYAKDIIAKYSQKAETSISNIENSFPKGTFIVYLDQKNSKIASEVLEPESENGFVKFETIKVIKNQELPIYRYLTNEKI